MSKARDFGIWTVPIPFVSMTTALVSAKVFKSGQEPFIKCISVKGNLETQDLTTITINQITQKLYGNFCIYPDARTKSLDITPTYKDRRVGLLEITYEGVQDVLKATFIGTDSQPLEPKQGSKKVQLQYVVATANGQSSDFDVSAFREANFFLVVSAFSGFTGVVITIKTKDPIGGNYFTIATFTTVTGVTSEMKIVAANLGDTIRADWVVTGTGSITLTVSAVFKG